MAKLGRQTIPAGGAVSMSGLPFFFYKSKNLKMIFKTAFLKLEKLHSVALKPRLNIQTLEDTLPAPDIIFHSSALSVYILSLVFMCLRPFGEVCV